MSLATMSRDSLKFTPGQKVTHPELGEGVVIGLEITGFVRVFFLSLGERQVPPQSLHSALSWPERIITHMKPATPTALEKLWLAIEAAELPLMESAATLTSAKVDLLPHQVVLIHRMAQTRPRRFLVADEVGLGKTIETALILRELASRGELTRALMVVPAGLVENWRQELNEVFNLDFEVFGSEGDVTDRKTNAFAKHNRLIASVDTSKRRSRVRRLLEAPPWDLVVFDEAHHLSVYKSGNRVRKTENFKLAEKLRDHCRDLVLLSATPHQGDHFRFWQLVNLLDSTLFADEYDMVENRHRLNAVVMRRTKADACDANGDPLFARRVVNTEGFTLSPTEREFYDALLGYLRDGYNTAEKQGNQGRALGFVMTIFQKIAASSFAAVQLTLRRRLLNLTIQEAIERDDMLDVDERDRLYREALELVHDLYQLRADAIGQAQAEQILAEAKVCILKQRRDIGAFVETAESYDDSEASAAQGEDGAAVMVAFGLPEERERIREVLSKYPNQIETKTTVLLHALNQLWQQNPNEKIVIFATYLGSVDTIQTAINTYFPNKGVDVLKGGDHGAKTAVQKRFKRPDGPQILVCTAAGREGINLQFARILFNYDLPWNPMDLEQRIGRIHRYGQKHTAQVYNLVATDTIEGQIYLLLEDKLQEIAAALGKVDETGQITEDLRAQVLGQLNGRLSYDKLYQDAVQDPTLKRTRQELEVAMNNATTAREVVFELFQDLDTFNLSDFKQVDDEGRGMQRLLQFAQRAAYLEGGELKQQKNDIFELIRPDVPTMLFTTDRDKALAIDELNLLGLEHPVVRGWIEKAVALPAEERGIIGHLEYNGQGSGIMTIWHVTIHTPGGQVQQRIVHLGLTPTGERFVYLERLSQDLRQILAYDGSNRLTSEHLIPLINGSAMEILHRQLNYAAAIHEEASYSSRLLACISLV
jgi:superfamily II DNA or RNA helicase